MDQYELIRTAHRVYGKSIREIRRETGHHRETIRKVLKGLEPKYRRRKPTRCPVMDPVAPIIEGWLLGDRDRPRRQRHTSRRIWDRLVEEHGFGGAESTVRRWVREWKAAHGYGARQAVVPLDPEVAREAEVDWGTAWVEMAGERRMVKLFVMRSRYSGKAFVRAYPWERQEMFFDAHMRAFAYYQGIFRQLVYDNLRPAVKKILRGKRRVEQEGFVSFRSYYTYEARFCNRGKGQEKGGVEGLIGYARRNFLVPLPRVRDFEELNQMLLERCQKYGSHRIAGREDDRTVQERFEGEKSRLLPLPKRPYENYKPLRVKVDRYQTVRVDRNRYSVPRAYVGRWVWAHVSCWQVEVFAEDRKIGEHERVFSNCKWKIGPLHYLDLISQRPGSFESARPILQWRDRWPEDYEVLLARLRSRLGENSGTREFVGILGLHQHYPERLVEEAITRVLELQCPSLASIRHWIRYQESSSRSIEPLPAQLIPGITDRQVQRMAVSSFNALLGSRG